MKKATSHELGRQLGGIDLHVDISAENLCFGYDSEKAVVKDFTVSFRPGTMTALTGASGCGKSTLLYLLGLMLTPQSGCIRLTGRRVDDLHDRERAQLRAECFGFVFQDAALDETRTVLDNVTETTLYRRVSRESVEGRAKLLLEEFGVDVPADRKPGQVSGGQAQRIALCRALLFSPALLLADEPTGNLDPATSEVVFGALQAHAQAGGTVIVATHSPQFAGGCDEVLEL